MGLVGSDGAVDLPEAVDLHGQSVAVIDTAAEQVLVLQRAEEPLDDTVSLRRSDPRARTWRSSGSSPANAAA